MAQYMNDNGERDGIDRRGMLKCMAWVGTGLLWTVSGGRVTSRVFGADTPAAGTPDTSGFTFAQISDSHIGFTREPNKDVTATLRLAVDRIRALDRRPEFVLHTGDLTHLSKPEEFDTVEQVMRGGQTGQTFYVPGEHDFFTDDGRAYLDRFGKNTRGAGWYSFDYKGVHFVGLVNVANLQPGGLGVLGREQLDWLEKDLAARTDSTPVVAFAHVPLWAVYPKWGWGTQDGERVLSMLRRFGAVTVLNGHIHQVMQKTEGNVTFHTARSTAFPQPEPGAAPSPGPLKNVPADRLKSMLGLTTVAYVEHAHSLAVVDRTLD